jgi:FkbM family methyltransferase
MRRLELLGSARSTWLTARWLWTHPIASQDRAAALTRWARWQIGSRILPGPVVVPFVEGTVLLVAPGMSGATGNVYAGLHEFPDMAFLLHFLRPGDLFVDVGANIGSYTILAGGVRHADVIAVEPVPVTFRRLEANVRLNRLEGHVRTVNAGLAATGGVLKFTSSLDCVNHVVADGEDHASDILDLPMMTLDELTKDRGPALIKVDVEGYETEIFRGGRLTLGRPELQAVIVELNGSGMRYGFDETALQSELESFGFRPYQYEAFARQLTPLVGKSAVGNTLYVRDLPAVQARVNETPPIHVHNIKV